LRPEEEDAAIGDAMSLQTLEDPEAIGEKSGGGGELDVLEGEILALVPDGIAGEVALRPVHDIGLSERECQAVPRGNGTAARRG